MYYAIAIDDPLKIELLLKRGCEVDEILYKNSNEYLQAGLNSLVKIMVMLDFNTPIFEFVRHDLMLSEMWEICKKEIATMQVNQLDDSSITYFELLRETNENVLADYVNKVTKETEKIITEEYFTYANTLLEQIEKGRRRQRRRLLINQVNKIMENSNFVQLPNWEIRNEILYYLSNGHLKKIVKSGTT